MEEKDTGICCPEFDPGPWTDAMLEWENKRFIRDRVFTVFYMPLNFRRVMQRLDESVRAAGAEIPDWLCLSDHTSKWNMDVHLAVDREIPGAENVTKSGAFLSRVYEGPYRDTGKWMADFASYAKARDLVISRTYMWYTTCPKCAKKYGRNHVAVIGEIAV